MTAETGHSRPSGAREFLTAESSPSHLLGVPGLAVGLGFGLWLPLDLGLQILVGCVVGAALFLGIMLLLSKLLPRKKTSVVVGVDGVLVRSEFVPYSDIKEVVLEGRLIRADDFPDNQPMGPAMRDEYVWEFSLDRVSRIPLFVTNFRYDGGLPVARDVVRATPLVKEIEEALASWRSAREDTDLADETIVACGAASGSRWLDALRRLGSGVDGTYRIQSANERVLHRLLGNPRARPSARAAAAIVLEEAGDPSSREKLRVAAGSMADPRLRVALDRVAEAGAAVALAEALDALEAAERHTWNRPRAQRRHSP